MNAPRRSITVVSPQQSTRRLRPARQLGGSSSDPAVGFEVVERRWSHPRSIASLRLRKDRKDSPRRGRFAANLTSHLTN